MTKEKPTCPYCGDPAPIRGNRVGHMKYCGMECYRLHNTYCKENLFLSSISVPEHRYRAKLLTLAREGDELSQWKLKFQYHLTAIWDKEKQQEIRL